MARKASRKKPVAKTARKKTPAKNSASVDKQPQASVVEQPPVAAAEIETAPPLPAESPIAEAAIPASTAEAHVASAEISMSDIPAPEELKVSEEALMPANGLEVEDIPAQDEPIGVTEADVAFDRGTSFTHGDVDPDSLVMMRAIRSCDVPPVVGSFRFLDAVGKEARSGKPVRGQYLNGYMYRVPEYVAAHLVSKDWAMRV